jgi:hypothetical protein
MTPSVRHEITVTDDEDDGSWKGHRQREPRVIKTGSFLVRQLKASLAQLLRFRPTGNVLPPIGQRCLILRGKAGYDEGQVGVVSDSTAAMVWVTFRDPLGKHTSIKLKRPSSLMMLDPTIIISQEPNGTLWIHSTCMAKEGNDGDKY